MSHPDTQAAHGHGDHGAQIPHFSMRGYVIGFVLSLILTAIPFWLVMGKVLPSPVSTGYVILGFAVVQIVVHMIYCLHMNTRSEGGWSMTSLIFTIIVVVIALSGSLWVMYHLNTNMMPMTHDMAQMGG